MITFLVRSGVSRNALNKNAKKLPGFIAEITMDSEQ